MGVCALCVREGVGVELLWMKRHLASKAHLWPLIGQSLLYYKSNKTPVPGREGDDSVGAELVSQAWGHKSECPWPMQNPDMVAHACNSVPELPRSDGWHRQETPRKLVCAPSNKLQECQAYTGWKLSTGTRVLPNLYVCAHAETQQTCMHFLFEVKKQNPKEKGAGRDNHISVGPSIFLKSAYKSLINGTYPTGCLDVIF